MPEDKVKLRAFLFDADAGDRRIDEDAIDLSALGDNQLLWIDVQDDDHEGSAPVLERLCARLGIDAACTELRRLGGKPRLQNYGDWFLVEVSAVECDGPLAFKGRALALVCGPNFVLSLHRGPLEILDELYGRERGETRIGTLHAQSFTVYGDNRCFMSIEDCRCAALVVDEERAWYSHLYTTDSADD